MYVSKLGQILDKDMIAGYKDEIKTIETPTNNNKASPKEDFGKLNITELKAEIKKMNLIAPKNAKKQDLIDVLSKAETDKK